MRWTSLTEQKQVPDWSRIKGLQPRLRSHTGWHRLEYRGHDWFLLQDRATNRHYHFTESAYRFLKRLDGKRSVEQALSSVPEETDDSPVRQQEAIDLLLRLQSADLLLQHDRDDSARLYGQWRKQRAKSRLAMIMRPLAVRLPLFDPTRCCRGCCRWQARCSIGAHCCSGWRW